MSIRPAFSIAFLITFLIASTIFLFQYSLNLEPCPLCRLEHIILITLAAIFLIGLLHNPRHRLISRLYGQIVATTSFAGASVAARHAWLKSLPASQAPECGEGLNYWINTLPPSEVIKKIFAGEGDCVEVVWEFYGFNTPELSLIVFILFLIYGIKLLIKGH